MQDLAGTEVDHDKMLIINTPICLAYVFWEIGTYRHKTRDVNGKSRYTGARTVGKYDGAVHSPEVHQPTFGFRQMD